MTRLLHVFALLLLLDNCEHVVDGAATLAEATAPARHA